ncbi:MAG: Txe/YoeB family addiction module toxin [Dysgonamonadaceae bacterium]|jgi:toxin YoeB|nr:Txe/YoeB family addiction module toxin [Dysgonamonadaceae bacterium]
MEFLFKDEAEFDLGYWYRTDKKIIKKIESLLRSMKETPFEGIGKPEALKENLSGYWSRRINREHRILYKVDNEIITIYSFRGHYEK